MLGKISHEQLSDDALAALGDDVLLDDLAFYLDVNTEEIYCENQDDLNAWIWHRDRLAWEEVRADWFAELKS